MPGEYDLHRFDSLAEVPAAAGNDSVQDIRLPAGARMVGYYSSNTCGIFGDVAANLSDNPISSPAAGDTLRSVADLTLNAAVSIMADPSDAPLWTLQKEELGANFAVAYERDVGAFTPVLWVLVEYPS